MPYTKASNEKKKDEKEKGWKENIVDLGCLAAFAIWNLLQEQWTWIGLCSSTPHYFVNTIYLTQASTSKSNTILLLERSYLSSFTVCKCISSIFITAWETD